MNKEINLGKFAVVGLLVLGGFVMSIGIISLKKKDGLVAQESARRTFVVDVVKKVSPAVVNISTEQVVSSGERTIYPYGTDLYLDEFYKDFFEPRFTGKQIRQSLGSGVIIDREGHVVTNDHVIIRAGKITVTLVDGRELEAVWMGSDPESDLALLKIKNQEKLPFLSIGNSDDIIVGEPAIAIGNPFGLHHTVTTGVISATQRSIKTVDKIFRDLIQTDAAINPGNSGGPLLNADGVLIGINTAIYQKAQGIGFAIPINRAKRIVNDLIKYGEVRIGWVGFDVKDLTMLEARKLSYEGPGGVLVGKVVFNGPAHNAGIGEGDVIEAVNGRLVRSVMDYMLEIRRLAIGEEVTLSIFRAGKRGDIKIKAADFPLELADEIGRNALGIEVGVAPAGIKAVSITNVIPSSPAHKAGLKKGDLLLKINDDTITNIEEYRRAIAKIRVMESAALLIRRGPSIFYVTLNLRF